MKRVVFIIWIRWFLKVCLVMLFNSIYLPNLQSLEIGFQSFYKTICLSLSSNSHFFIFYRYIFLIYNHSKQDISHSMKQQTYLYQVIILYPKPIRYSFCEWKNVYRVSSEHLNILVPSLLLFDHKSLNNAEMKRMLRNMAAIHN